MLDKGDRVRLNSLPKVWVVADIRGDQVELADPGTKARIWVSQYEVKAFQQVKPGPVAQANKPTQTF